MRIPYRMAAAKLLFLLLSTAAAAKSPHKISVPASISPATNSSSVWLSPSRKFAFGFYDNPQGYAICIFLAAFTERTVVWTANKFNPILPNNIDYLFMNYGGLRLWQTGENQDYIYEGVATPPDLISWGSMLDNGNFVLYNSVGSVIWQSFDHPTSTLLVGQRLPIDAELFSTASQTDLSMGLFRIKMQSDGNLVQYPVNTPDTPENAYYYSGSYGVGPSISLTLANDGGLYFLDENTSFANISRGGNPVAGVIYLARLDADDIFRIYNRSLEFRDRWRVMWRSLEDKCAPKGICGVNSFCSYENHTVTCTCLPGFSGSGAGGCKQEFDVSDCKNNNKSARYGIRRMVNVTWEDNYYNINETTTEEECGQACVDDCDCVVALFKNGQCRRQRSPLRYGKSSTPGSSATLIRFSFLRPPPTPSPSNEAGVPAVPGFHEAGVPAVPGFRGVPGTAAAKSPHKISAPTSISPATNSSSLWLSPSRKFAFGFYDTPQGYAVCIFLAAFTERTVVWTANKFNPILPNNIDYLLMNYDGLRLWQTGENQDYIYEGVATPPDLISWGSMLDNGNFGLYNSDGSVIWQSFDHPTSTLLVGQRLPITAEAFSTASQTDLSMCFRGVPGVPSVPGTGSGKGSNLHNYAVVIGSSIGVALLLVSSITVYYFKRQYRFCGEDEENKHNVNKLNLNHGSLAPKRYSYKQIRKITKHFTEKLGQGGYGIVYKGKLPDGEAVAVKVLTETHDNAVEFVNEVASISRTSHVNIVNLLGFCFERKKRALIYEFMPNKSLDKFIYKHKSGSVDAECRLEWKQLYEIAVGVARGLEYLHRGCNTTIIHFDIKPQNILLDEEFCPKISDFGLAKLCMKQQSAVSMLGTRGTVGFIAPEVFSRNFGVVSHKSDVYSYGIMLLQIAEARTNVEEKSFHASEDFFLEKIYEHVLVQNEKVYDMISEEEEEVVRKMLTVGFWCIQTAPSDRPSMNKVVDMLGGSVQSIETPPLPFLLSSPKPQFSGLLPVILETESSTGS